jgi:predicted MPP superfamily phosphohydrolase
MFSLILHFVGTLLHGYCTWRVGTLPLIRRRLAPWQWWLFSALVWLGYVGGVEIGDDAGGRLSLALAQFAFHWLVVVFLLGLCLLAVDVLALLGRGRLRSPARWRTGALALGGALAAIALVQGLRAPEISRHELAVPGLPAALDGTTLVAVSDLHLGGLLDAHWLAARIEQIRLLEPDVIALVGDLTEGDPYATPGLGAVLARLRAPLGVWAVTGNHEFHGDTPATIALFEASGVRWLRDEAVTLAFGLRLAGVDDLTRRARRGVADDGLLGRLGAGEGAAVLLSHSPLQVETAARAGFDVMIAGHTHGGQVWPFGYLVRQRYEYFLGRYEINGMHLLVGRGTGTWGPRMRLWRPGEILHITLRAA